MSAIKAIIFVLIWNAELDACKERVNQLQSAAKTSCAAQEEINRNLSERLVC